MVGTVITFYSYKGGVGRSFALANIATILAQWGYRVLVVDWDIEAPGLNHFFARLAPSMPHGVLDFLDDCMQFKKRDWSDYVVQLPVPEARGTLHMMPAASGGGADYTERVQKLDWDLLFDRYRLGSRLEDLRATWVENFDLVLIDSRTGVTDFSGLTTAQLPDILAFMFTANNQSFEGCSNIARRAMEARRKLPIDRPALIPLPIVARFEQREEYDRAQKWRSRFASELEPFLDTWTRREVDRRAVVDCLTIPYVPRWTFGEDLAALEELPGSQLIRNSNQPISYALETLASLLALRLEKIELLTSSRDEYVHSARTQATGGSKQSRKGGENVFISYIADSEARKYVEGLRTELTRVGLYGVIDESAIEPGSYWEDAIQEKIRKSDACIMVFSSRSKESKRQDLEAELFIRESLRSSQRKPIVPVVLRGGEDAFKRSRAGDFQAAYVQQDKELGLRSYSAVVQRLLSIHGDNELLEAARNPQGPVYQPDSLQSASPKKKPRSAMRKKIVKKKSIKTKSAKRKK